MSEKQIESVKKIYDVCVDVLNHFLYLENVQAMLNTYKMRKSIDPDHDVDAFISEISNRMYLVVDKEYFYLRGTEIYDELAELTIDIANEDVTTLQPYIENKEQVEKLVASLLWRMKIAGGDIITATISMGSIKRLGLEVGKEAYAVIKATSVMVGVDE